MEKHQEAAGNKCLDNNKDSKVNLSLCSFLLSQDENQPSSPITGVDQRISPISQYAS